MATPPLPTGTVTFLFSDIENSTPLWEQHGAAMRQALVAHDAAVRAAIESHGGVVVKTTGDGFHAAFASPVGALSAAVAAQQALLAAERAATPGGPALRVRIGLHTGEADLRDGDYYGSAVNRAARLMSIAHGAQIVVSGVTAELATGELPPDVQLRDLGEHRLRGLARTERVYQVVAAGLPHDFPPLRTMELGRGNLPEALTSFVGRTRELAEVQALLADSRLLTLTGPGGTGKTRLSLEIGRLAQDRYQHGVWLVELAPLSDPDLVPAAVAELWGLREGPQGSVAAQLADFLRAKELLLILDNCEHLVAACARLADDLLRSAPRLTILASSREGLGIGGETTYHLSTLSFPPPSETNPELIGQYESVQLFVERAQSARPTFQLAAANAAAISQIVRRLDGIPLAIELAAVRVKLLPPEQLAARLDDRFRLLTGGSRTALPRQQTLRALIDWSYDLLDDIEKWFFRQLSVFAGGWTLEAAEAVALDAGDVSLDAFDLLAGLVNKSLVTLDDEGGETRFGFLETIRQYARDKLFESGETAAARNRHLDYYAGLMASLGPMTSHIGGFMFFAGYGRPELFHWSAMLRSDHENLRLALEWALDTNPDRALALALDMAALAQFDSTFDEAIEGLESALERVAALPPVTGEATVLRNRLCLCALTTLCILHLAIGATFRARSRVKEAADLARNLGDHYKAELATALGFSGATGVMIGAPDSELVQMATEAIALYSELNFPAGQIGPLGILARHHFLDGDVVTARELLLEAVDLHDSFPNNTLIAIAGLGLFHLSVAMDMFDTAREVMGRTQAAFRELNNEQMRIVSSSDLGHLERRLGNDAAAEAIMRQTIQQYHDLGHRPAVAHQLESFAFLAIHRAEYPHAATLLGAAETLRAATQTQMLPGEREEYDRELAVLRQELPAAQLEQAWQAGRQLDIDDAVALALAGR